MAEFEDVLSKYMRALAPAGGFGIPNLAGLERNLSNQADYGARTATIRDAMGLQRQGAGRSVSAAFAPGTRQFQAQKDLLAQLMDLHAKNAQLSESQRQGLMSMLIEPAYNESHQPSWWSQALGTISGLGAQYGLSMLPGAGPGLKQLQAMLNGGGGNPSTAGYNPAQTRAMLNALGFKL